MDTVFPIPYTLLPMLEIRSPRPDELDPMLALMCGAFGLPFNPAREVFYKDPYFDVNRKRVLRVMREQKLIQPWEAPEIRAALPQNQTPVSRGWIRPRLPRPVASSSVRRRWRC